MKENKELILRSWLGRDEDGTLHWFNNIPFERSIHRDNKIVKEWGRGPYGGIRWLVRKEDDVFPEVKSTDEEPTEIKFKFNIEFVDKDKK